MKALKEINETENLTKLARKFGADPGLINSYKHKDYFATIKENEMRIYNKTKLVACYQKQKQEQHDIDYFISQSGLNYSQFARKYNFTLSRVQTAIRGKHSAKRISENEIQLVNKLGVKYVISTVAPLRVIEKTAAEKAAIEKARKDRLREKQKIYNRRRLDGYDPDAHIGGMIFNLPKSHIAHDWLNDR